MADYVTDQLESLLRQQRELEARLEKDREALAVVGKILGFAAVGLSFTRAVNDQLQKVQVALQRVPGLNQLPPVKDPNGLRWLIRSNPFAFLSIPGQVSISGHGNTTHPGYYYSLIPVGFDANGQLVYTLSGVTGRPITEEDLANNPFLAQEIIRNAARAGELGDKKAVFDLTTGFIRSQLEQDRRVLDALQPTLDQVTASLFPSPRFSDTQAAAGAIITGVTDPNGLPLIQPNRGDP